MKTGGTNLSGACRTVKRFVIMTIIFFIALKICLVFWGIWSGLFPFSEEDSLWADIYNAFAWLGYGLIFLIPLPVVSTQPSLRKQLENLLK